MKKIRLFILGIAVITKITAQEFTNLSEFKKIESQIIKVDTLEFIKVSGEKGTQFYFDREDFNVSKYDKVTIELKELYEFNENISISGIIYLNFKVNGENIFLKQNKYILIKFPNENLTNKELYTSNGEFEKFNWIKEKQIDTLFSIHRGGGIFVQTIIKKDSVQYYKNENLKSVGFETYADFANLSKNDRKIDKEKSSVALIKNLGWIKVEKIN